MKHLVFTFALMVIFLNAARAMAEPLPASRTQLQSATGPSKVLADAMLVALENQDRLAIRANAKAMIDAGHTDWVIALLSDPMDRAKEAAALALSAVKSKEVAENVLNAYLKENYDAYGGTEQQLGHEDTIEAFETSLTALTFTSPSKTQTIPQKGAVFAEAIRQMR